MIYKWAILIFLRPVKVWKEIADNSVSAWLILAILIVPFSAITSFATDQKLDVKDPDFLLRAVIYIISVVSSIVIGSYMLWRMLPRFLSSGSLQKVIKLVSYSYMAVFLAFILASMHDQLDFIKFFGLYSAIIYWIGLSYMLNTPDDRKMGFLVISGIILTGIGYVFSIVLNNLFLKI